MSTALRGLYSECKKAWGYIAYDTSIINLLHSHWGDLRTPCIPQIKELVCLSIACMHYTRNNILSYRLGISSPELYLLHQFMLVTSECCMVLLDVPELSLSSTRTICPEVKEIWEGSSPWNSARAQYSSNKLPAIENQHYTQRCLKYLVPSIQAGR